MFNKKSVLFHVLQPEWEILPKSCKMTTGILSATRDHPNDNHGLPVGGLDIRNSSYSFALQWRVFIPEVGKFKWLSFI